MEHSEIIAHYRVVGDDLRRAVGDRSSAEIAAQPAGDQRSIVEQIGYLHRYSIALNRWIDGITTQDRPSLPALTADLSPDPDVYRDRAAAELIAEIEANSRQCADKLAALDDADWLRECVRTSGEVTELEGLVSRIAGENQRVIADIAGRPRA
jgi:DNA-directed RNA polymerase specialized sigma24 family protein